jgi:hypothetical protein
VLHIDEEADGAVLDRAVLQLGLQLKVGSQFEIALQKALDSLTRSAPIGNANGADRAEREPRHTT